MGPSKPRTLIFHREVEHAKHAEDMMLSLMRQCRSLTSRRDLGHEWFEFCGTDYSELIQIADIVKLAAKSPPEFVSPPLLRTCEQNSATDTQLKRAFRTYFSHMDKFVTHDAKANSLISAVELMNAFENSDVCPVFAEYLPYGEDARLKLVEERYFKNVI